MLIWSIVLIVFIVSILGFSITVRCNLRIIQITQQTLGWNFGLKRGSFSRLLEFTGICKYFTRYVWEINKIPLGVMTSNFPQGKNVTLRNHWGRNIFPGKKRITIVICHLGRKYMQSCCLPFGDCILYCNLPCSKCLPKPRIWVLHRDLQHRLSICRQVTGG